MPTSSRTVKNNKVLGNGQLNTNFTGSAENCRMDISGNEVEKNGTLSFETSIPKGDGKVIQNVRNNTVTNQAAMKGDVVTATEGQKVHVDGIIEENLVSGTAQLSTNVTSREAQRQTEDEIIENARETGFVQKIIQWFRTKNFLNFFAKNSSESNRKTETSKEELPPQKPSLQYNEPDLR